MFKSCFCLVSIWCHPSILSSFPIFPPQSPSNPPSYPLLPWKQWKRAFWDWAGRYGGKNPDKTVWNDELLHTSSHKQDESSLVSFFSFQFEAQTSRHPVMLPRCTDIPIFIVLLIELCFEIYCCCVPCLFLCFHLFLPCFFYCCKMLIAWRDVLISAVRAHWEFWWRSWCTIFAPQKTTPSVSALVPDCSLTRVHCDQSALLEWCSTSALQSLAFFFSSSPVPLCTAFDKNSTDFSTLLFKPNFSIIDQRGLIRHNRNA